MMVCGYTVYPPIATLFIHTGWLMDEPKNKYIKRENAGDQYVGIYESSFDQLVK